MNPKKVNKQAGYTLAEVLIVLTIFLMVITITSVSFKPLIQHLEIKYFFKQLQLDIAYSSLYLSMDNGDTILYQKYNTNIRRQVNGLGNEILLQNANTIHYEIVSNGVVVSIEVAKQVIKKRLSMAPTIF